MAWTQEEHDELEGAYKQGVLEVQYQDRKARYRSREQMKGILLEAKRELGLLAKGPIRKHAAFSKGLEGSGGS